MTPRRQCSKCPWKVSTDPHDIPDGYSVEKHRKLAGTVREGLASLDGPLRIMACHETSRTPCVGWLDNQLANNNLGVRLAVCRGQLAADYELDGPQHPTIEATLP
tara:strand:+ start:2090 stop:2404 length:315 start_codon:yes stop_codon:yes gene_type:complete